MSYDVLKILSYVVVFITILTMIFGVVAYRFYKIKEKRRARNSSGKVAFEEKAKYLYFEEKELL